MSEIVSRPDDNGSTHTDIRTRVLIIYTGGTIGMVHAEPGNESSPLVPGTGEELQKLLRIDNPFENIYWELRPLLNLDGTPRGPLDSSSVGPNEWILMASAIEAAYRDYDGFVILHGTDTMAYTASALSFLLQNLSKPVILTGSQLPIAQPRTDAINNFINALYIAGYKAKDLPCVPEVAICFSDVLLRGNRTTKVSTSKWQGFDSPNFPHLGKIGEYITINESLLLPRQKGASSTFFVHKLLRESVATIPLYPGMSDSVLSKILSLDVQGFILRSFGTGNAPEKREFGNALRSAISAGKIVVNTTQCLEGSVEMGLYAASSALQDSGVITGLDLTPEAAITKLMWILGTEVGENITTKMQISQRGEQSASVYELKYGEVQLPLTQVEELDSHNAPHDAGVVAVRLSQRPAGQFQPNDLLKAILRVDDVRSADDRPEAEIMISVFVNLPSAATEAPTTVPQYAGDISGRRGNREKLVLLRDVTAVVSRVYETGQPISLTLVLRTGKQFSASGLYLTLTTK